MIPENANQALKLDKAIPISSTLADVDVAQRARRHTARRLLPFLFILYIVAFLGWIFALASGRYPRGMRDLTAYWLRYQAQTWGYLLLVTDRYPTLASTSIDLEKGAT